MELPSNEDEVVDSLIQYHKEEHTDPEIHPEQHYNYYGDRGIVDLFVETQANGSLQQWFYEAKSESAVRSATGANEIIRQFNRMRDYFFKGSEYSRANFAHYKLVFVPTAYNIRHLAENRSLYQEIVGPNEDDDGVTSHTQLALHIPSKDRPVDVDVSIENLADEVFWQFMFSVDRSLAKELQETFEEICGPLSKTEATPLSEVSYTVNGENITLEPGDVITPDAGYANTVAPGSTITINRIEEIPGEMHEFEITVEPPDGADLQSYPWEGERTASGSLIRTFLI